MKTLHKQDDKQDDKQDEIIKVPLIHKELKIFRMALQDSYNQNKEYEVGLLLTRLNEFMDSKGVK